MADEKNIEMKLKSLVCRDFYSSTRESIFKGNQFECRNIMLNACTKYTDDSEEGRVNSIR